MGRDLARRQEGTRQQHFLMRPKAGAVAPCRTPFPCWHPTRSFKMAARAAAASMASHLVVAKAVLARSACAAPPRAAARAQLRQAAGTALQQGHQQHRRQAVTAVAPPRRRRFVAVSVAAPAAAGPHASPVYGGEVHAAVDAVRLASRLCQVGGAPQPCRSPVPRSSAPLQCKLSVAPPA